MKKVKTKLISQNCFMLDNVNVNDINKEVDNGGQGISSYYELQRKPMRNGIVEELVEVDYPITQEKLQSEVDSTDYKKDPFGSSVSAVKKTNIGDITNIQDLLLNDSQTARELYNTLADKFQQEYNKQQSEKENKEQGVKE